MTQPNPTPFAAIVLAAGKGTRMKSARAKVLHPICGRPMIAWALETTLAAQPERVVVVTGHQADEVQAAVAAAFPGAPIHFARQEPQSGTGHAVQCALPHLDGFAGPVLIRMGDAPLLAAETQARLLGHGDPANDPLCVLAVELPEPQGYGRVLRTNTGHAAVIVEELDATLEIRRIREVNTGIYRVSAAFLRDAVTRLRPDNQKGELYLTDIVAMAAEAGHPATVCVAPNAAEVLGINTRAELAEANTTVQKRINRALMDAGVTFIDPATAYVAHGVSVGEDTVVHPGVTMRGGTSIGRDCVIGEGCVLDSVTVHDGAHVLPYTVCEDTVIGRGAHAGPFARLRPGTVLGAHVKIGNFVETKKAVFGEGAKASHLSYIGDAHVGRDCNIGAGTITCNYDGKHKHQTVLEDGVFIGSDTQLVAPVRVGRGSYVGAGSTITKDVPSGSLAITRVPQKNIEGWVDRKAAQKEAKPPNPTKPSE